MEFKEYNNPSEGDYDIKYSYDNGKSYTKNNPYSEQLINLIGILEDVTDEELQEYGITMNEYLNPTAETVEKVAQKLNTKHR